MINGSHLAWKQREVEMLLKNEEFTRIAAVMADRFSHIVKTTGGLTEEQMRLAIRQAHREGLPIPLVTSARSMRMINEAYAAR